MKKSAKILNEQPNIVKEFYLGNTHVKIADNSLVAKKRDDAAVLEILDNIAKIAINSFRRQQSKAQEYQTE